MRGTGFPLLWTAGKCSCASHPARGFLRLGEVNALVHGIIYAYRLVVSDSNHHHATGLSILSPDCWFFCRISRCLHVEIMRMSWPWLKW